MKWRLWYICANIHKQIVIINCICKLASCLQGHRDCYPEGYAAPGNVQCQCNMWRSPSKLKSALPQQKIYVTSKSPVGDISVVTLIRTDTTLDHSQEAERVWSRVGCNYDSKQQHVNMRLVAKALGTCWAEAPIKIARMTLSIKLDGNWNSFQLANITPPLSVTGSAIAPSARMTDL